MNPTGKSFLLYVLFPLLLCHICDAQELRVPIFLVDRRPFIEVDVNGVKGHFILDSGGRNGLDETFAQHAGIPKVDSMQISGAGNGTQIAWLAPPQSFQISGTTIVTRSERPMIINLEEIRDSLHLPYLDGVIGVELFRDHILGLDYHKGTLAFFNEHYVPENYFEKIHFTFYRNQIPLITATVNGTPGQFTVDTGDRSALTIFPEFYKSTGFPNLLGERKVTGYGIGGPVMAREFILKKFRIGDQLQFDSVKTRVPDHSTGSWSHSDHAGNIGSGLFTGMNIIFDYQRQEIYFYKPSLNKTK